MDVNGTKFHLLFGKEDWENCLIPGRNQTLRELEAQERFSANRPGVVWEEQGGYLALRAEPPIFQQYKPGKLPQAEVRRGAARDFFGNWFWVDDSRTFIAWQRPGYAEVNRFWPPVPPASPSPAPAGGLFKPVNNQPLAAPPYRDGSALHALAITTQNYLVVGYVYPEGDTRSGGLLVFDLHRPTQPVAVSFDEPFSPWDMVAAPGGGVLILDRMHGAVLRWHDSLVLPDTVAPPSIFQPADAAPDAPSALLPPVLTRFDFPQQPGDPLSVEAGPDDSILVLFTRTTDSAVWQIIQSESQPYIVEYLLSNAVLDEDETIRRSIRAADMAFTPYVSGSQDPADDCPDWLEPPAIGTSPVLVVVERDGNQAIAFRLLPPPAPINLDPNDLLVLPGRLETLPDYLPMRLWGGRGLVASQCEVFYDFGERQPRWLPLQTFGDSLYAARGVLQTSPEFPGLLPIQHFDGETPGCVWHRLLIDAILPLGTNVVIRARAADDPELLVQEIWRDQPPLYLRGNGSELPYFTLPALRPPDPALIEEGEDVCDPQASGRAGTWELLFQEVVGRYVQLEITLEGSGRATPQLYALRAWYPRFSYLQYLPAIYREHPIHSAFLERWLANFEGLFTHLEDQIVQVMNLFDPRITPPEALEWLAGWLGLLLDPLWEETQRRFFIRHALEMYKVRGTLTGIDMALRLYLDKQICEALFDPMNFNTGTAKLIESYQLVRLEDRAQWAHQFIVRLPRLISRARLNMVERILELEKPAHTSYTLQSYLDGILVCQSYLGLDSRLAERLNVPDTLLGSVELPESLLGYEYPYNVRDRIVIERDTLLHSSPPFLNTRISEATDSKEQLGYE